MLPPFHSFQERKFCAMTNEQFRSPFNLHLQCFNHLGEIDSLVESLGESEIPTLCELESIAHSMHSLLLRIDCYISLQAKNIQTTHRVPNRKDRKGGEHLAD